MRRRGYTWNGPGAARVTRVSRLCRGLVAGGLRAALGLLVASWLCGAGAAGAEIGTWSTSAAVGINTVDVTISISCPAPTFVCSLVDGYWDMQTATVIGSGTLDLDVVLDEIRFETDGMQDVGVGPQPAFATLSGTPLQFALIPFAGVPEIESLLVFALTNAALFAPGLEMLPPGDHPFSGTLDYAATADVVGDLELTLSDIVVPGQSSAVAGVFRSLGDPDTDGFFEYQLRDYTASVTLQQPGNIGGEPVTITVTADLVANLSGELPGAPPPVPGVGAWGRLILALALVSGAMLFVRRARSD